MEEDDNHGLSLQELTLLAEVRLLNRHGQGELVACLPTASEGAKRRFGDSNGVLLTHREVEILAACRQLDRRDRVAILTCLCRTAS